MMKTKYGAYCSYDLDFYLIYSNKKQRTETLLKNS